MLQTLIDSITIQVWWDMLLCHWVGGFQGQTHCHIPEHLSSQKHCCDNSHIAKWHFWLWNRPKNFRPFVQMCVSCWSFSLMCTELCVKKIRSTGTNCEPSFVRRFSTGVWEGEGCKQPAEGPLAVGLCSTALPCLQEIQPINGKVIALHPHMSAYLAPCDLLIFPKLQEPLVREKYMLEETCWSVLVF